jgi:hypothetical protein
LNAAGGILGGEHSAAQLCLLLCPLRPSHNPKNTSNGR